MNDNIATKLIQPLNTQTQNTTATAPLQNISTKIPQSSNLYQIYGTSANTTTQPTATKGIMDTTKINPVSTNNTQQPASTVLPSPGPIPTTNNTQQPTSTVLPSPGPIPTTSQPAATGNSSVSISVSSDAIQGNKQKLEEAANELGNRWEIIQANINRISESWVGKDAEIYTEKLKKMQPKINKIIEALRLISNTYQKALNEIESNQDSIKSELL